MKVKKVMSDKLRDKEPVKSVIVCGIEAHVCVLQTTMDLVDAGFEVHVLTDGNLKSLYLCKHYIQLNEHFTRRLIDVGTRSFLRV